VSAGLAGSKVGAGRRGVRPYYKKWIEARESQRKRERERERKRQKEKERESVYEVQIVATSRFLFVAPSIVSHRRDKSWKKVYIIVYII